MQLLNGYSLEFFDGFEVPIQQDHFGVTGYCYYCFEALVLHFEGGDGAVFGLVDVDLAAVDSGLNWVGGFNQIPQFYELTLAGDGTGMQSKGIDDWGGGFFLEGEVEALVNSAEGSIFVRVQLEGLDLAGPAPDQHQIMSVGNIVVLYLVGTNWGQFISRYWPYIDAGIWFHSCGYYKFLALGDVDCALVAFENISGEFFHLFKVDSSFSFELEIGYCFLEI